MRTFRRRLAEVDALPQLALLGIVSGLCTGAVILAFRAIVELPLMWLLPGGSAEDFESLPQLLAFLLPAGGALILGLCLQPLSAERRRVGVNHVMERLSRHQGDMPKSNVLVQFIGGTFALLTGQSGGREGPSVHLGAAAASALGRQFLLPNNSVRTMVACGTAAAVSAAFNTPIAGVIFAMEVVMMEYNINSFVPVMLAAVSAALLTVAVYGPDTAFTLPAMALGSLLELPFLALCALIIGALAAAKIVLLRRFMAITIGPFWLRITVAGLLTGAVALVLPQVLGIGYDTVNAAALGELGLGLLLAIGLAKLVLSAMAVGVGMPMGLIGPSLVIGACIGGAIGLLAHRFYPGIASDPALYVLLGMGAMMGAVLQAPLAALMAVLELTATPGIIMPAMLVIVLASLTTSQLFGQKPLFVSQLEARGVRYGADPFAQALQRVGVASLMERSFARMTHSLSAGEARKALNTKTRWVVVDRDGQPAAVLNSADLELYLDGGAGDEPEPPTDDTTIDLLAIPGQRKDVTTIDIRATVAEALATLDRTGVEALCVRRMSAPGIAPIFGILTRDAINSRYTLRN